CLLDQPVIGAGRGPGGSGAEPDHHALDLGSKKIVTRAPKCRCSQVVVLKLPLRGANLSPAARKGASPYDHRRTWGQVRACVVPPRLVRSAMRTVAAVLALVVCVHAGMWALFRPEGKAPAYTGQLASVS